MSMGVCSVPKASPQETYTSGVHRERLSESPRWGGPRIHALSKALPSTVQNFTPHFPLASSLLPDMDPLETRLLLINEHPGWRWKALHISHGDKTMISFTRPTGLLPPVPHPQPPLHTWASSFGPSKIDKWELFSHRCTQIRVPTFAQRKPVQN